MSLPKHWDLRIDPSVGKVLKKLPHRDMLAVLEVMRLLTFDPYFGDIQKMKGEEHVWRRRIGSYRLFFKFKTNENIILVFHLERRASNTY
jgi:mRNA-degrading endonuclease RelE of RelBE toxin-antitoxin system